MKCTTCSFKEANRFFRLMDGKLPNGTMIFAIRCYRCANSFRNSPGFSQYQELSGQEVSNLIRSEEFAEDVTEKNQSDSSQSRTPIKKHLLMNPSSK